MSDNKLFVVTLFLLIALLAACGPTATEPGAEEPDTTPLPEVTEPPAESPMAETPETEGAGNAPTAAAVAQLASELGVAEADIEVVSAEATEFSDSCLGLGGPAESCLQAITPGWLIMLDVDGQVYEVHTDQAGQQVRVAGEAS